MLAAGDLDRGVAFLWDTNTADTFVSQGRFSNSVICFNGALLLCTCSSLLAMLGGRLRVNSKSGHLTAGHYTATTLTHTSSPGSSLPNLPCLDTETVACYSEIAL